MVSVAAVPLSICTGEVETAAGGTGIAAVWMTSGEGSNDFDGGVDGRDILRSSQEVGVLVGLVGIDGVGGPAGVGRGSQAQIWAGCDHHPAIARIFSHPRGCSLLGLEPNAPQITDSACSVAAIAMLLNSLRGVPPHSVDPLVTQQGLLDRVANVRWTTETAQDGAGVTFDELVADTRASLEAYGLAADLDIFKPQDDSAASLAQVRRLLIENELSDRDIVLVYFDQGVLTGDWDGPHISPIATYDADLRHVLIMDVDRQWYIPYWSSDERLLAAMLRPAPASMGVLAGQTGGLLRVRLKTGR